MKITYTAYYTDGVSGTVEIDKPHGAHPESICALQAATTAAEMTGRVVKSIGRSKIIAGAIVDEGFLERGEIFRQNAGVLAHADENHSNQ